MKRNKIEFPMQIKNKVIKRSGNHCERCYIDFDEEFVGEFHHIIPISYGGKNSIDNCTLLCHNCHLVTPNIKNKKELLIYKFYFLRFASFKEAAKFYGVDNRFDLYVKISQDITKHLKKY